MINYRKPIAFFKKDLVSEISYQVAFFLRIFDIFFSVATFYFLAKLLGTAASPYLQPYGGDYFSFLLIGIAFSNFLSTGLESFAGNIRIEQLMGTLEAMLVTPTKLSVIVLSSSLWNFLFTSFSVLIHFLIGVILFGLDVSNANIGAALLLLVLTIIVFSSIGIISASFIMIFKRGAPLNWVVNQTARFLGGVLYPIEVLPPWLRKLSHFHPITYTLKAVRHAVLQGYSLYMLIPEIVSLVFFSVILLPLSILAFKYGVKKAKIQGSLTQY